MQFISQANPSLATTVLAIQNTFKKDLLERDATALYHLKNAIYNAFSPSGVLFASVNQSYNGIVIAALTHWWGITAKKSLKKILERLNAKDSFIQMNLQNVEISDKIVVTSFNDEGERHFGGLLSAWNMTGRDAEFLKEVGINNDEFALLASITYFKAIDGKVVFYCRNAATFGYRDVNSGAPMAEVVQAGVENLLSAVGDHKSFYALVNEGISLLGHIVGIFDMATNSQVIKGVDVKDIKFVIAERADDAETPAYMMPPTRTLSDNNGDAVVTIGVGNFDDEMFVTQVSQNIISARLGNYGFAAQMSDFPKYGHGGVQNFGQMQPMPAAMMQPMPMPGSMPNMQAPGY